MSNTKYLASILVITYNQEESVKRTLDSLLEQKTTFPYEIVVGDDCSMDRTREVLKEYAQQHDNIKVIYNEHNLGIVGNFVSTIKHCTGKYIAECAGDDQWTDPRKLQKQVDILELNPEIGLVYTQAEVDASGVGKRFIKGAVNPDNDNLFTQLLQGNFISAPTVCYHSSLLKYVNFNEFLSKGYRMEDYPMWLEFANHCKFFYIPEVTVRYAIDRVRTDNVESIVTGSCLFGSNVAMIKEDAIRKHPNNTNITITEVWDSYYNDSFKEMLFIKHRKEAIMFLRKIVHKTRYQRFMQALLRCPLGMKIYWWRYQKKHGKTKDVLSVYLGM